MSGQSYETVMASLELKMLCLGGNVRDEYGLDLRDWLTWWVFNYRVAKVPPDPEFADLANRLQAAAERVRVRERVAWRGLTMTDSKIEIVFRTGAPYTLDRLSSVSSHANVAKHYAETSHQNRRAAEWRRVVIRFEDQRGVRGVPVPTRLTTNGEIVGPRGYKFHCDRVVETDGCVCVDLHASLAEALTVGPDEVPH